MLGPGVTGIRALQSFRLERSIIEAVEQHTGIAGLRIEFRIGNDLKRVPREIRGNCKSVHGSLKADLNIAMVIESKKGESRLFAAAFEFLADITHLIVKPVESGIFSIPKGIILRKADLGEAVDELIDGHFGQIGSLHDRYRSGTMPSSRLDRVMPASPACG